MIHHIWDLTHTSEIAVWLGKFKLTSVPNIAKTQVEDERYKKLPHILPIQHISMLKPRKNTITVLLFLMKYLLSAIMSVTAYIRVHIHAYRMFSVVMQPGLFGVQLSKLFLI